ncbi:hypothetical protein DPMN_032851 [Dreissena polymorpha]|uniref:Uncharacterized protein n=1 Tax=Dreissena polymorpha TaxID=45954 RepID=A0A9D4M7F0_DREPO|nr:hypothetical protein DPMN_032851 [Dreissena polymorpha]
MISPVSNISITDNGIITKAYDTKTFHVSMDSYGTAMCVAVSFSTDDPRVWLYGDSVTL